jgi:hypothetical protein
MARNEREPVESAELLAAIDVPAPEAIERTILEGVNARVAELRAARGPVSLPTDTFGLQRKVAGAVDYLRRYETAVRNVRKGLLEIAEEEAIEGGNEVTDGSLKPSHRWNGAGLPAANVRVPDGDDTWVIERQFDRAVSIDWGQVFAVLAEVSAPATIERVLAEGQPLEAEYVALEEKLDDAQADALAELVGSAVTAGMARVAELLAERMADWVGPSGPKSSGVQAYAKGLSAQGHDQEASIVAGAVVVDRRYSGVKVERQ